MSKVSTTIRNLHSLLQDNSSPDTSPTIPGRYPSTRPAPQTRKPSSKRRPSLQQVFSSSKAHDAQEETEPLTEWQLPSEIPRASTSRLTLDEQETERLDSQVNSAFFQAGTTDEGLPMLVLCPCSLPKEGKVTDILDRLITRLEPYVSTSYLLVFFASPTSATLSTTMLVQRYMSLSRNARKNVQRLYIVHPGFWTRMIMRLFLNGIVSNKVNKKGKLKAVSSLSELAENIDITLIEIPPLVYEHNLKVEPTVTLPPDRGNKEPCFGVPLADLMGKDGDAGLPAVVKDCIKLLRQQSFNTEGIFRVSPSASTLRTIREAYDRGHPVNLSSYDLSGPDAPQHLAASLLKTFLRELPMPVITSSDYALIDRCPTIRDSDFEDGSMEVVEYIRDRVLPELSARESGQSEVVLMASVLELLHEISLRSVTNKMDAYNLAVCMAPVFLRSEDLARDVSLCHVAGSNPFASKTSSPSKFRHKHKPSRSGSSWSNLLNSDRPTFGSMLRVMISRYHEIFPSIDSNTRLVAPIDFPAAAIHTPELSSSTTTTDTSGSSPPQPMPALSEESTVSFSPPASPSNHKARQRTRTKGSLSNSQFATSISPSQAGSVLSFGAASGKASLRLMSGQGTISRRANAEASALSVAGLFDVEPKEKEEPVQ